MCRLTKSRSVTSLPSVSAVCALVYHRLCVRAQTLSHDTPESLKEKWLPCTLLHGCVFIFKLEIHPNLPERVNLRLMSHNTTVRIGGAWCDGSLGRLVETWVSATDLITSSVDWRTDLLSPVSTGEIPPPSLLTHQRLHTFFSASRRGGRLSKVDIRAPVRAA